MAKINYWQADGDSNLRSREQEQQDNAAARYAKSAAERERNKAAVADNDLCAVEDKSRIELRESLLRKQDALAMERVLGGNDLLQINYLTTGLAAARAVCRVHITNPGGLPSGYGSGFLVAPYLLLTNHHVLPTDGHALRSEVEFDYEFGNDRQRKPSHYFHLSPQEFYYSNAELDFALVAIDRRNTRISLGGSAGEAAEESITPLKLNDKSGKALLGESVSIVQHPNGLDKRISIRNNHVVALVDEFIHYETDTERGSSGSPVFNDQWDVVALHHAGVPKFTADGDVERDHRGEVIWVANEGIRISAIFRHLKEQDHWSGAEARKLEDLGTFSTSDLNSAIAKFGGARHILQGESGTKHQTMPNVLPITLTTLIADLQKKSKTELDFAPYFVESRRHSDNIDPKFRINHDTVMIDRPELQQSAELLNPANELCKRARTEAYYKTLKDAKSEKRPVPIKIIAYGDSWFQYPFFLNDVIDHLAARDDLAILSFGSAGQTLRYAVSHSEFVSAINQERPDFFLLSAGCNDLMAYGGIKRFVRKVEDSFHPEQLIDHPEFAKIKAQLVSNLTNLFSIVLRSKPDIKILCHGYSSPIPNNGRWLGRPMNELGITDSQTQAEIARIIFDDLHDAIAQTAESFPGSVHCLDVRDTVPSRGWYDELHPTNPFYGDVTAVFEDKIRKLKEEMDNKPKK